MAAARARAGADTAWVAVVRAMAVAAWAGMGRRRLAWVVQMPWGPGWWRWQWRGWKGRWGGGDGGGGEGEGGGGEGGAAAAG